MKRDETQSMAEPVTPEAVQNEVAKILASEKFGRSKKLRRLLQFTVDQTLQGNADTLKEYVIGTEVLKKPDSYDPRRDSLVRVMASRLRVKLKEYYNNGGSEDPLVIELPKGKYVPRFQTRESLQTEVGQKLRARNVCSHATFLANKFTEESLNESVHYFQEAIEADSRLVAAHAGLAHVYSLQGFLGLRRPAEVWAAARAAAKTALELDEMNSDAHLSLGMTEAFFAWRRHASDLHLGKAIETDPYSSAGHLWRALTVLIPGEQLADARAEIEQARELSPAPFLSEARALTLYFAEEYDAVLDLTEHAVHTEPGSIWLLWTRAMALAGRGWFQASVDLLIRLDQVTPGNPRILASLGYAYSLSKEPERVPQVEAMLDEWRHRGVWVSNYDRALMQVGLGNRTEALALLQLALQEREAWMPYLTVDPRLRPLSSEPEFIDIAKKVFAEGPN